MTGRGGKPIPQDMELSATFEVKDPDHQLSPSSGMGRVHWEECRRWLTDHMFAGLDTMEGPMVYPKVPGRSYPREDQGDYHHRAAEFEGLSRSLYLTAGLIQDEPDYACRGVRLIDYYRKEIRMLFGPDSPRRLTLPQEFLARGDGGAKQTTVELSALATALLLYPRLWDVMDEEEKGFLVNYFTKFSTHATAVHNWRFFNIMMMLFLRHHGYPIDDRLWTIHLDALMAYYAGDGWYRDGHFDFYSSWVFHIYFAVWCRFFAYENEPELATLIELRAHEKLSTYPRLFSRDGSMPMWGRSIVYRYASACILPGYFFYRDNSALDPGWARRICSGCLLQFMTRPDFLRNGVPSLGFYGPFDPCVNPYSCAASPMWGHLLFVAAFALPPDHSFWTAKENEGDWESISENLPRDTPLPGPGILVTNYHSSGHSELRTAKFNDAHPGYSRLCYHTLFPWEAPDQDNGVAMHYSLCAEDPEGEQLYQLPARIDWCGVDGEGVLHRMLHLPKERGPQPIIELADFSLPNGVLRIDRPRLHGKGTLRLAHFGLPHLAGVSAEFEERWLRGGYRAITARIPGRQIALIPITGWLKTGKYVHRGFNAEAEESSVIYAEMPHLQHEFHSLAPLITLLLHKADDSPWTDGELMPIASWRVERAGPLGVCGVEINLNSGRRLRVCHDGIEGRRSI